MLDGNNFTDIMPGFTPFAAILSQSIIILSEELHLIMCPWINLPYIEWDKWQNKGGEERSVFCHHKAVEEKVLKKSIVTVFNLSLWALLFFSIRPWLTHPTPYHLDLLVSPIPTHTQDFLVYFKLKHNGKCAWNVI